MSRVSEPSTVWGGFPEDLKLRLSPAFASDSDAVNEIPLLKANKLQESRRIGLDLYKYLPLQYDKPI